MSAPFVDPTALSSNVWVPLAVLSASLLGSLHCVAMCGGLAAASSRSARGAVQFHLGRMIGYVSLGALAGGLGSALLSPSLGDSVAMASTVLLSVVFVLLGISNLRGKGMHLFRLPQGVYRFVFDAAEKAPLLLGLGTALLPCGWLHSFLLGAVATRSATAGAAFMALFWLGTLPALGAAQGLLRKILRPLQARAPRLAGTALILAGVLNLAIKFPTEARPHPGDKTTQTERSCH